MTRDEIDNIEQIRCQRSILAKASAYPPIHHRAIGAGQITGQLAHHAGIHTRLGLGRLRGERPHQPLEPGDTASVLGNQRPVHQILRKHHL